MVILKYLLNTNFIACPQFLLQGIKVILVLLSFNRLYFLATLLHLKELEHRKLGWKVFILKYDLGKSVSKEMWCKMADTKNNFDNIF